MKRLFLAIPLLFLVFSFLFLVPNKAMAASCTSSADCSADPSLVGCSITRGVWRCSIAATTNDGDIKCTTSDGSEGINTAIGCVYVGSGTSLVETILRIATGVGGGLALALILYGVFVVTTSAGMPDKLKAGSEIITSAIIGLIFILLSVFLVNLIGINILGIPGLS
jgi:hypothetical protein